MNCPNCGHPNRARVNFCENCGTNLAPPTPPPPPRHAYAPVRPGCPAGFFTSCLNWTLGFTLVGTILVVMLVFLCVIDVPAPPYQSMLPDFAITAWERLDDLQAENCSRSGTEKPEPDQNDGAQPQPPAEGNQNEPPPDEAVGDNESPCYLLGKVRDVTLPDGTRLGFNERADKKWEITNAGTCPWDEDFQLVFVGGDPIVTIEEAYINQDVLPGESVEVWVPVVTGTKSGTFTSYWKMRTTSGEIFGGGEDADASFWVKIVVADEKQSAPSSSGSETVDWGMDKIFWVGTTKCPTPAFVPEVTANLTSSTGRSLIGYDFILTGTQNHPLPERSITCKDPGGNDFYTVSLEAGKPVQLTARFIGCDITNYIAGNITLRLYSAPQNLPLGEFSLPFEHTCGK